MSALFVLNPPPYRIPPAAATSQSQGSPIPSSPKISTRCSRSLSPAAIAKSPAATPRIPPPSHPAAQQIISPAPQTKPCFPGNTPPSLSNADPRADWYRSHDRNTPAHRSRSSHSIVTEAYYLGNTVLFE